MTAMYDKATSQRGFTLMEVLIVVAIIAVLTSVAIPVFGGGLDRAKESTDLANMRGAYAAATAEWMSTVEPAERYYYANGELTTVSAGIIGYGQSEVDASTFAENLPVPVMGIPNKDGDAQYITILMDDKGVKKMYWGTNGYSGPVVKSPADYLTISNEEKLMSDIELFDALQEKARTMTYGELLDLMSKYKVKSHGSLDGGVCYRLATSCIDLETGVINQDANKVVVKELFDAVGFNTDASGDKLYIFGSVPNTPKDRTHYECYIDINLGVSEKYAKAHRDEIASTAITYENDQGTGKHALSWKNRKDN